MLIYTSRAQITFVWSGGCDSPAALTSLGVVGTSFGDVFVFDSGESHHSLSLFPPQGRLVKLCCCSDEFGPCFKIHVLPEKIIQVVPSGSTHTHTHTHIPLLLVLNIYNSSTSSGFADLFMVFGRGQTRNFKYFQAPVWGIRPTTRPTCPPLSPLGAFGLAGDLPEARGVSPPLSKIGTVWLTCERADRLWHRWMCSAAFLSRAMRSPLAAWQRLSLALLICSALILSAEFILFSAVFSYRPLAPPPCRPHKHRF